MPLQGFSLFLQYALALMIPLVATLWLTPLAGRLARRLGILDHPRDHRFHSEVTPYLGGLAVAGGLVFVGIFAASASKQLLTILLGGFAIMIVGFEDDRREIGPVVKIMVEVGAAVALWMAGVRVSLFGVPARDLFVTVLWVVAITNAMNLLDNMDGLASGVTAIAAIGLALTFPQELGPGLITVLVALAGSVLAFLVWNRPPARLFMGNCGSLAIGGILAGCSTVAVLRAGTISAAVAAGLILITPLFDTTFVIVLRRLAGRSTTRGNIDHTSHRLVSAGFAEPSALAILYAVGVAGAASGWIVHGQNKWGWPLAAVVSIGTLILGLYLARVPAFRAQDADLGGDAATTPLLSDLNFRWHAAEVLLDLVMITLCYYTAYHIRFEQTPDLPVFLSTFSLSLPIILGCKLAALYASGLYSRMWSTFGLHDLSTVLRGATGGLVLSVLAVTYLFKFGEAFSRSVFLIDWVLLTAAIVATRSSFRIFGRIATRSGARQRRVAIRGAGVRGQLLVREMLANAALERKPVAFIDDNQARRAQRILGVPVRGSLEDLDAIIRALKVDEVLLSSPSINGAVEARVREICAARDVAVRRLRFEIQ
jgi:UDP-GlcNAc:undecaprenyl-phosphate GlcNAc-1-phosphate transferase